MSGLGIFIITSYQELQINNYMDLLAKINTRLAQSQLPNGSWMTNKNKYSDITANISSGDAGILLYLLLYRKKTNDQRMDKCIHKCLQKFIQSKLSITNENSLLFGWAGVAYTFLKAYEIFKNKEYKELAEKLLGSIKIDQARENFSLGTGLSGIGYILLEASKILNNESYKKKAKVVASYIHNFHLQVNNESIFWYSNVGRKTDPGLFHGNTGIILFLLLSTNAEVKEFLSF